MNIAGGQASVKAPDDLPTLPGGKGTYALRFHLDRPLNLRVGRLGAFALSPGVLIYVGSALGPGGLAARLRRHLRPDKRLHWHIDYLTTVLTPTLWHADDSGQRQECAWIHAILNQPGAWVPIPGFGSSDCQAACPAHLLALPVDSNPNPQKILHLSQLVERSS